LSFQTASLYGKRYFLKCAKKTSNLASINSTQVKNFPVLLAPIDEQEKLITSIKCIEEKQLQIGQHMNKIKFIISGYATQFANGDQPYV
jgi:type I restriction enzyme, S subunit